MKTILALLTAALLSACATSLTEQQKSDVAQLSGLATAVAFTLAPNNHLTAEQKAVLIQLDNVATRTALDLAPSITPAPPATIAK